MKTMIGILVLASVLSAFAVSAQARGLDEGLSVGESAVANQIGTCTVNSSVGYATAWYDTDFSNPPNITGWNWLWTYLPSGYSASGSASRKSITVKIVALAGAHPTILASKTCKP